MKRVTCVLFEAGLNSDSCHCNVQYLRICWFTVLQNRVNPKSNAPEISKGATKLERNFQHKSEISQKLNDIRLRKVIFKVNLL